MKTMKLKYLAAGLLSMVLLSACNDDLNRFPHEDIELSQSFETVNDAATWNTGMYGLLKSRVYGLFMYSTDIQADQLNATLDYGNRNGGIHRWDFLAGDYTIRDTWAPYYSAIANANMAIEGMATIETEDGEEQAELDQYIGEAHFIRAFYYHQLALRFADAYDPGNASSQLGVPLVLEYDPEFFPERSSLEEVYQQILADISAAKAGLSGIPGEPGSIYINEDVVTALEARVRFYMEDWAGAKSAADELINSGTYPLYNSVEGLEDMWYRDARQEDIFQLFTNAPTELANANVVYLGYQAATGRYTPDFVPTQSILDLYEEEDIRKDVYFEELPTTFQGSHYDDVFLVNKYPGNPELFTGSNTNYQHAPKVFRIAEMYLISAESAAQLGQDNEAQEVINALRSARGVAEFTSTGDALLNDIREERTRELAFEGFRLDDLKRWNEGFSGRQPQNASFIQSGADFQNLTIEAGHQKFTWGIPSNDITINNNLVQNPGW